MNEQNSEIVFPKCRTCGSSADDKYNKEDLNVIEKSAYDKAVGALKLAQKEIARLNMDAPIELTKKTGSVNLHLIETLKELGELT